MIGTILVATDYAMMAPSFFKKLISNKESHANKKAK